MPAKHEDGTGPVPVGLFDVSGPTSRETTMLKSIAIAGVTAALVLGSIAVAQTQNDNTQNTSTNPPAGQTMNGPNGAATSDNGGATADQNAAPNTASNAGGYGNNAAANPGAGAGERG